MARQIFIFDCQPSSQRTPAEHRDQPQHGVHACTRGVEIQAQPHMQPLSQGPGVWRAWGGEGGATYHGMHTDANSACAETLTQQGSQPMRMCR